MKTKLHKSQGMIMKKITVLLLSTCALTFISSSSAMLLKQTTRTKKQIRTLRELPNHNIFNTLPDRDAEFNELLQDLYKRNNILLNKLLDRRNVEHNINILQEQQDIISKEMYIQGPRDYSKVCRIINTLENKLTLRNENE